MVAAKIKDSLTLEEAIRVLQAAVKKATEIAQPQDIAVCDIGGNLKAVSYTHLTLPTNREV